MSKKVLIILTLIFLFFSCVSSIFLVNKEDSKKYSANCHTNPRGRDVPLS